FAYNSSGGGGGGGFSGGAGTFVYQVPGGGGSFNVGIRKDNKDGNSYGQTGHGRVVISWKTP
ncbi:hypothetical protein, partial [Pararcticibacter amylolyticus]|uniref:hypothetical protein n=1 Tax=Pararcticibacter amylolyticus TaxID=2173175 RepID=UPI00192E3A36